MRGGAQHYVFYISSLASLGCTIVGEQSQTHQFGADQVGWSTRSFSAEAKCSHDGTGNPEGNADTASAVCQAGRGTSADNVIVPCNVDVGLIFL